MCGFCIANFAHVDTSIHVVSSTISYATDYFPGLIPLVYAYLDHIQCDSLTMDRMTKYLTFIEKRATGQLETPATWIRNFIRSHKDYKFDSVVTDSIAYDLMVACNEIGLGKRAAPELLGDVEIRLISATEAYVKKLESKRVNNEQVISLLERYASRKTFRGSHSSGEQKRRTLGVSTRDGETEAVAAEYSI